MENNVNYGIFRNESGDYQVLPKGGYIAPTLKEVPIQEFLTESKKTGWRPEGSNIIDPTVTNIDQARAKYGSGTGQFFTAGNTQFDTLMRNSQYADIINKLQQGQETSAGKMVDGNFTTNEALAQQQANEAAVKAGTMKVAQVVNGVPVYLPTNPMETRTPQVGTGVVQQGTQGQPTGQQQTQQQQSYTINGETAIWDNNLQRYVLQTPQTGKSTGPNIPTNITPQGYDVGGEHYALNPTTGRFEKAPATQSTASYGPVTSSPTANMGGMTTDSRTALQRVIDMTTEASKALGVPMIKEQIEKVVQDQKDLAQKKQNEINDINNNPWLSQDIRNKELNKIDANYKSKEETYSNLAKLYDSMYQQAQSQVKSIVAQTEDDIAKAMDLAQKQQEAVDKLKQDYTFQTLRGRDVLVDKRTGKIIVDYGPSKSSSGGTEAERKQNLISTYQSRIDSTERFQDGTPLLDTQGYFTQLAFKRLISSAVQDGIPRADFLKTFGYRINPNWAKSYGITPAEVKLITGVVPTE